MGGPPNVGCASQPHMPPSLLSTPQEKLQKCLEPLEQKLQEVTRCKSSEEKKPGELKVQAGNPIRAALQAGSQMSATLCNLPILTHFKDASLRNDGHETLTEIAHHELSIEKDVRG